MALITGITSGSNKIASPFTIGIIASDHSSLSLSFHNVKLEVRAWLYSDEHELLDSSIVTMSTPTQEAEHHTIDISSALRTAADRYEFAPDRLIQPHIFCAVIASDEYMTTDGKVHKDGYSAQFIYPDNLTDVSYDPNTGILTPSPSGSSSFDTPAPITLSKLTLGRYSEYERLRSGHFKNLTIATDDGRYSRKPLSPEVVPVGHVAVVPAACDRSVQHTISSPGASMVQGHPYYADPSLLSAYTIRFVNGLGLIESVSVQFHRKVSLQHTATQYDRNVPESFGAPSRSIYRKSAGYEEWQMSSGPVTYDWLQWWHGEFGMAECAWIWLNGLWLPIHIVADDKVEMLDTTKVGMLSYTFTIRFDISGQLAVSPLAE